MTDDYYDDEDLFEGISQLDKIDASVEKRIEEMAFLWKAVVEDLNKERKCFKCGTDLKDKNIHIVKGKSNLKGTVFICSVCDKCKEEVEKNDKKQQQ